MAEKIESVSLFTGPATGDYPNQYSKKCGECDFRNKYCQTEFAVDASAPTKVYGCKVTHIMLRTLGKLGKFQDSMERFAGPHLFGGEGAVYVIRKGNDDFLADLIGKLKLSSLQR